MRCSLHIFTSLAVLKLADHAPTEAPAPSDRHAKLLPFLDYAPPDVDYSDDYLDMALEEEDQLARSSPPRPHQPPPRPPPYNSPIYYIRLPAQPYVFVPGLGYVSQPSRPQASPFVNVPVSFVANGKPGNIYQWSSGAFQGFAAPPAAYQPAPSPVGGARPQKPRPKPQKPDSTIHRLPGAFSFNGKPEDVFVLRDSYNSLLNDVLQNVYP